MIKNTFRTLIITSLVAAIGIYAPVYGAAKKATPQVKTGATCCQTAAKTTNPKTKASAASQRLAGIPKMLDLGSTTCIPCKMMVPVMDQLTKEHKGKLSVEFIDVTKNEAAAKKYNIKSIPTQILFDAKGKEVFRHIGYFPKNDILAAFKAHGVKLEAGSKGK